MEGVPGYRVVNVSRDGRYTIEKRIIADPERDVVLQHISFRADGPDADQLRIFALLAPHLVNAGAHNTAWIETLKGWTMAFASGRGSALALGGRAALQGPFGRLCRRQRRVHAAESARLASSNPTPAPTNGTVAICAELDLVAGGETVLALGFGRNQHEAGNMARASLFRGYPEAERRYVATWEAWQAALLRLDRENGAALNSYRVSTAVLRTA